MHQSPESASLADDRTLNVTLYSRPGCHLCEEAKAVISPLLSEFGAILHEVNIDVAESLVQNFGSDIPVIFIGDRKVAKHRVNIAQFRRQLLEASSRRRQSVRG